MRSAHLFRGHVGFCSGFDSDSSTKGPQLARFGLDGYGPLHVRCSLTRDGHTSSICETMSGRSAHSTLIVRKGSPRSSRSDEGLSERHQGRTTGFMIERQHTAPPANGARMAIAGVIIACGALATAGPAAADPNAPTPVPGQPVVESPGAPVSPPAPPPDGAPPVPEIANPVYGQGQGPLGALRDLWHQVRDGPMDSPYGETVAPPPGAGPPPPLPPGYVSINAPGSETPSTSTGPNTGGPPLPPGYYPLNGPPPPGYDSPTEPNPTPPPALGPVPPTP